MYFYIKGVDNPDLDLCINVNPGTGAELNSIESYAQRLGRVGRHLQPSRMISLFKPFACFTTRKDSTPLELELQFW